MERRDLFRILTVTAVAAPRAHGQHDTHKAETIPTGKLPAPRFFSASDYKTLEVLCERLLPSDEDGPGAKEAGVAASIDTIAHYADARAQQTWKDGIASVDEAARTHSGKSFAECGTEHQGKVLDLLAENESAPRSAAERFFVTFKRTAIDAFGASKAGRQFLGYRGDTAIPSFPGCTHPEHQGA